MDNDNEAKTDDQNSILPRHVAIIMDGNGRWALKRNQPRIFGHKEGVKAVTRAVEAAAKHKVEVLSLFAFSSENWLRPKEEVHYLLRLFLSTLKLQVKKLHENKVCLQVIGDISRFSEKLQEAIHEAEALTKQNTGLKLIVAANYGGQWDIMHAIKQIASQVKQGQLSLDQIDQDLFSHYLTLAQVPYPDLLIRTSGEQRISNYFLWQMAYSELYFTDVLWPDFNEADLEEALKVYAKRQRRFGGLIKQRKK